MREVNSGQEEDGPALPAADELPEVAPVRDGVGSVQKLHPGAF